MISPADEPRGTLLTRLAFALVLVLLIARSLMSEAVRDAGTSLAGGPAAPGATTILVLDWLSLLPPLLVLARRLVDRSFTLRAGVTHALLAAFALWAVASTIWADDKFLAFISATRLLAAASLFWTMTQLVRRWDHLRVVAGLLVGLLVANVAQGVLVRNVDQPDMVKFWAEHKAEFFEQRGWTADDYEAQRFEKKLLAGEMFGFNASPNTLGALVVMFVLVAAAAAAQRISDDRRNVGLPIALTLIALAGLYLLAFAGSKASWGALLVGLSMLALWRFTRRALARSRLLCFASAIALIALAVVSVAAIGLATGGLPEDSLNFRWRYWVGAWRIVLAHPLFGVGWSNFAEHYLATRLPQAAEEIQDPHNFGVRAAAELGLLGLGLCLAWLVTAAWRATGPSTSTNPHDLDAPSDGSRTILPGLGATFGIALLVSIVSASDIVGANGAFVILDSFKRFVLVSLIAGGGLLVLLRSVSDPRPDARPAPWLAAGLVVALAMLLLQSTIDIALFQIAPLLLASCTAGAIVGIAWRDAPARRDSMPLIALIGGSIACLALLVAVIIPIGLAEGRAARANAAMEQRRYDVAARLYELAFTNIYPLDNVDYALKAATAWASVGPTRTAETFQWLDRAIAADPSNSMAWLTRARWRAQLRSTTPADVDRALGDFAYALTLNPSDAPLRIEYADLLERAGRGADAAAQIAEALRIDDELDPSEPERLDLRTPGTREALAERVLRLRGG